MHQQANHDDGIIELTCKIRGLEITIKGPSSEATSFLASITSGSLAGRTASPAPTAGSFELVSSPTASHSQHPRGRQLETRDQILATFGSCPSRLLSCAGRLGGLQAEAESRIRRAWLAGKWAKATIDKRVLSPCRSEPIDLRARFYAVAFCESLDGPVIFRSSGSYWAALGSFGEGQAGATSVSHSFPSELEAKIYLEAAGLAGRYTTRD